MSRADFAAAVENLPIPGTGTDLVAPLLANYVRFARPRRVLEVGMDTPLSSSRTHSPMRRQRIEGNAAHWRTRARSAWPTAGN